MKKILLILPFLFTISEGLEEYAVARTRRGLRALLSLVPDTATVRRGGRERTSKMHFCFGKQKVLILILMAITDHI